MASTNTDKVQIVTPVVTAKFPNLLETEKFDGTDTGKYSLTMVIKPEEVDSIEKAIAQAGGGKGRSPLKLIATDDAYHPGAFQVKAKSKFPVRAVDVTGKPVDLSEITNGAEIRVKLGFAPYTQSGGGVTCYLGDIQVLKARKGADIDFGDLPEGYGEFEEGDLPF
jgi:hypothetical protein